MNDQQNHLDRLKDLDARQNEVLEQLNQLNARVVGLLKQFMHRKLSNDHAAAES